MKKNIKKCGFLVVLILLICVGVLGCASSSNNQFSDNEYIKKGPSMYGENDEPIICISDLNLDIIQDASVHSGFSFSILYSKPLTEKDIKINLDTDLEYNITANEQIHITEKFPEYVYLNYSGIDWVEFRELANSDEEKKFERDIIIGDEYNAIEEDTYPIFYNNSFTVYLDTSNNKLFKENSVIDTMEIIIDDKTYTENIGIINMIKEDNKTNEEFNMLYGEYELTPLSAGRIGYNINYNREGLINIRGYQFEAKEDVVIKDIKVVNKTDGLSMQNAVFNIGSDDTYINQEWVSGSNLTIEKGSEMSVDFLLEDNNFKETTNYAVNIYIEILYEYNGKMQIANAQANCETKHDDGVIYAIFKDDEDFKSYYADYFIY